MGRGRSGSAGLGRGRSGSAGLGRGRSGSAGVGTSTGSSGCGALALFCGRFDATRGGADWARDVLFHGGTLVRSLSPPAELLPRCQGGEPPGRLLALSCCSWGSGSIPGGGAFGGTRGRGLLSAPLGGALTGIIRPSESILHSTGCDSTRARRSGGGRKAAPLPCASAAAAAPAAAPSRLGSGGACGVHGRPALSRSGGAFTGRDAPEEPIREGSAPVGRRVGGIRGGSSPFGRRGGGSGESALSTISSHGLRACSLRRRAGSKLLWYPPSAGKAWT